MTTYGASSAQSAAWDSKDTSGAPTIGWFLRRSALWAAIVVAGIISACALYAIVTNAEATGRKTTPATTAPISPLGV
ncbi:hypothetical protein HYPDE_29833 [Hyphomicrobium denitrificans 1NES1]|uniref:Uncharacterized protein n=1 Tax=Hyphomicrobium denitrificans 1NES1 TaxID=670307 RepID=N0BAU4_9HYPH|nr:hypothetical protein [Hyphomicrobium denitrificans]AGK57641.1 hypothetical protein HYPDE_29833 [Hyphomicrobium denitrificans 1NES1]